MKDDDGRKHKFSRIKIECNDLMSYKLLDLIDALELRSREECAEKIMYGAIWLLEELAEGGEIVSFSEERGWVVFNERELEKIKERFSKLPKEPKLPEKKKDH